MAAQSISLSGSKWVRGQGVTHSLTATELLAADNLATAGVEKLRFFPLTVASGHGSFIVEMDGRELLDLSSGWTAVGLGYGHPVVVDAVSVAIATQGHSGGISAVCESSVLLAQELIELLPEIPQARVYLGNSGTDANDVALRACRAWTKKKKIIAFKGGYHGGMGIAMGVSGVHVEAGVIADPDVLFLPFPNPLRPHTGDSTAVAQDVLTMLEALLVGDEIAAVIIEPIQSDGGVIVPPAGFLADLINTCRFYGVPVICDEVKVGLGRTGELFDFRHDGVGPDIVTLGKALGGGLPLSAAIGPDHILNANPGSALLTTAGNPVCTAAGRAVLRVIKEEDLPSRSRALGELFQSAFASAAEAEGITDCIGEVRGRGLTIGIDLVTDLDSLTGDHELARLTVYRAYELGVVCYYVAGHVLEVTPALTVGESELVMGAQVLARAIAQARAGEVSPEKVKEFAGW